MNKRDRYVVTRGGSIATRGGGILYASEDIRGLSLAARKRLAQLHSQDPDLCWEGDGKRQGAQNILTAEGLI